MDDPAVTIGQNNLGGVGPDSGEEVLRFLDVGTFDEQQINMEVTIVGGIYAVNSAEQNRVHGKFGQINMKADFEANMKFCFVSNSNKKPVTLDTFSITFHDFGASSIHGLYSSAPPLPPFPFTSSPITPVLQIGASSITAPLPLLPLPRTSNC